MSNLVKKSHLKDVTLDLWNKVKEKFNLTIINGRYDKPSKTLKLVKGDNTEVDVVLNGIIDKWEDLEHVSEYSHVNLMDFNKKINGRWYPNNTGEEGNNGAWSIYKMPVQPGEQYTILRKRIDDSKRFVFLNADGGVVEVINAPTNNLTGWYRNYVTVPTTDTIAHMGFCFQHNMNTKDGIMVLRGRVEEAVNFIPFIDNKLIQIGKEVSLEFNNEGSNLTSNTVERVIKEIGRKFGNVTDIESELNRKVETWKDLEHASEYSHINLIDYNERIIDYSYRDNDTYKKDSGWSTLFLDVKPGKAYTIYRKVDDNSRYIFTNSVGGAKINAVEVNTKYNSSGFIGTAFTVPNNPNISKVAIQFNHTLNSSIKDMMIFEGNVTSIDGFVPYTDGKLIQIGKEVSLEFDGTGTNLKSQTIHSAIKELDTYVEYVEYAKSVSGGNLFNKDKLTRGKYVAHVDGSIGNTPGWGVYWSDFGVKPGDKFIVNQTDPTYSYYVWFVHEGGGRFERTNIDSNGVFTVPNNERIVGFVINVKISDGSENTFMLYRGDTMPSTYQPYGGGDYVLFPHQGFKFAFDNGGKTILGNNLQTAVSVLATRVMGSTIGELKVLVYDAGETIEFNDSTWLRCDGQTVNKSLLNGVIETLPIDSELITLPTSENGEYKYVCIG